nr:immunoglobulin light chain junction region [Macaca mulatta]
CLQYSFSPFTF